VGRSNDLSKFVRNSAEGQEAYTEVDILDRDNRLQTIRRIINSDNKGSKWTLNNRTAKQVDVKAFVKDMSIDVDNLCSFMPQDKVGNFSRFTPKEMLRNTLLSIEDPSDPDRLSEEQTRLSNIQDHKEDYRRQRDAKVAALDTKRRDLEGMRDEMQRMEQVEKRKQLLNQYRTKLLGVEINDLTEIQNEKQKVVSDANELLSAEKRKFGPLEVRERGLRRQQASRDKAVGDAKDKQRLVQKNLGAKNDQQQALDEDVENFSDKLRLLDRERAKKEGQRGDLEGRVQTEEATLQQLMVQMPAVEQDIRQCKADTEGVRENLANLKEAEQDVRDKRSGVMELGNKLAHERGSLKDYQEVYRQNLARGNQDRKEALTAHNWLREHEADLRRNGSLRGDVFGPVGMYCDVEDPALQVMLEHHIPNSRLLGFLVDNDADGNFLKHQFREQLKLRIDIYTIKNAPNEGGRASEAELRELDINGYLVDQLKCPPLVRAFFCSFQGLHTVLWRRGADNLTHAQQERLVDICGGRQFKVYIHDPRGGGGSQGGSNGRQQNQRPQVTFYNGKVSQFSNQLSTTSGVADGNGMIFSHKGGGDVEERRNALEQQLADVRGQQQQADRQLSSIAEERKGYNDQSFSLSTRLKMLIATKKNPQNVETRLGQLRRSLQEVQQALAVGAQQAKAQMLEKFSKALADLLKNAAAMAAVAEKLRVNSVDVRVAEGLQDELVAELNEVTVAYEEAKREVRDIEKLVAEAEKKRKDSKKRMDDKVKELDGVISASGVDAARFAEVVYAEVCRACPEDSVEEISERIDFLEVEIERVAANPDLQRRFKEVGDEVRRLEEEAALAEKNYSNAESDLENRALNWVNQVTRIQERLHQLFGAYMRDLQLDGEVMLRPVGKYSDYELALMVKYRAEAQMAELDGSKHSGGERAVATVMFLMALQEMTSAPFRVVDEINQGMDESNERLVFDRVVKSCCSSGEGSSSSSAKPQYFLVTPKLLQSLNRINNQDVTVLLVLNGPGAKEKWDFDSMLKKQRRCNSKGIPLEPFSQAVGGQERRTQRGDEGEEEEEEQAWTSTAKGKRARA
jgi:chromosome segregation ATPase